MACSLQFGNVPFGFQPSGSVRKNIFSALAFCQWLSIMVFKSLLLSARLGSEVAAKQIAKIRFLNIVIRYWRVSRAFLF